MCRFMGTTEFAPGKWIGVELLDPRGKNNGTVNGKEYFKCADQHGLFLRSTQIQVYICIPFVVYMYVLVVSRFIELELCCALP